MREIPEEGKKNKDRLQWLLKAAWILCGALLLFFLLSIVLDAFFKNQMQFNDEEEPIPLVIHGDMYIDGEHSGYSKEELEASRLLQQVKIVGHVSRDIKKGEQIILRLNNLTAKIKVNGKLLFEISPKDNYVFKTPGYGWVNFRTPGISREDTIEIELTKSYRYGIGNEPAEFLNNMYVGSEAMLLRKLLRESWLRLLIDLMIMIAGLLGIVLGFTIKIFKQNNLTKVVLFSLLTFASGTWFVVGNPVIQLMVEKPLILYIIDFTSQFFIALMALAYVRELVTDKRKRLITVLEIMALLFITISVLLQMAGVMDFYELLPIGIAFNVFFLITLSVCIGYEGVRLGNREAERNLLAGIPLLAGGITEIINFTLGDGYTPSLVFSAGFFLFLMLKLIMFVQRFVANAKLAERAAQIENELTKEKISIMLSQIQPHFLYNALTSISMLCELEPQKAKQASIDFSIYLRGNMDALNVREAIPFIKERTHVETYLALEKIRFEEKLNVQWDIETEEFFIPPLSLQPIVENAVKHGIGKRGEGGSIIIQTRETEEGFIIKVSDNGVGFEPKEETEKQGGIHNVKQRLRILCEGSLTIKSIRGEGTEVEMRIPKKGGIQDESFSGR